MKKKSFMDNPIMQFLSTAEKSHEAVQEKSVNISPEYLALIGNPPEGYKINPIYVETKKRRLQLVLKPSLYKKVKDKASQQGISVNEYVHRVLESATMKDTHQ